MHYKYTGKLFSTINPIEINPNMFFISLITGSPQSYL